VLLAFALGGCSEEAAPDDPPTASGQDPSRKSTDTPSAPTPSVATDDPTVEPSAPPDEPTDAPSTTPRDVPPVTFDSDRAMHTVRHLSLRVGPREATSPAFAEAADWVEGKFGELGYDVSRQRVLVPAGNSWGIDVPAGTSSNVVADPTGFRPTRPHVVIGAHLDTVPQAPGAEDNASGISVVLELARMVAGGTRAVPVRFVAFGAEEPRGDGDALHHFGSRRYVELMTSRERRALVGMVSLDRVGTRGPYVPACSGPGGDTGTRDDLARAARALDLQVRLCDDNASSDHWSFTKAGLPSARLGSIPYAGYHSAEDLPRVVDPSQLTRVGRTMWRWLGTQRDSP
jgi:hypothetical protein